MSRVSLSKFFAGSALSLAVASFSLLASPFIIVTDAQAGKVSKGKVSVRSSGPVFRGGIARQPSTINRVTRSHGRSNNFQVIQRQRQVNIRNDQLQRRNELRLLQSTTRRSGPNGRFLSGDERGLLLGESLIGTGSLTSECPSKHNCGYRIYGDGSGPRIITPGVDFGNDLPKFDGVNGPAIITLD